MSHSARLAFMLVFVGLVSSLTSCRLKRFFMDEPEVPEQVPKEKGRFRLQDGESQTLSNILGGSLKKTDSSQELRGIFDCQSKASGKSCFLRTWHPSGDSLSSKLPVKEGLVQRIYQYVEGYERRLRYEPVLLIDIDCQTSESPRVCHLGHPRLLGEYILDKASSIEVAGLLKGNSPFVDGETVRGTLLCQWKFSRLSRHCVLRPMYKGILTNTYQKTSPGLSDRLSSDLKRLVRYFYEHQHEGENKEFFPPNEILTQIQCTIDLNQINAGEHGQTICKATI